jgi:7-keto-8-aminopelargonate synthetase-like enzyme
MSRRKSLSHVIEHARPAYDDAERRGLMRVSLRARSGKRVTLPDGHEVTEFVSCSYLGLDQHPRVIAAAKEVLDEWGVHFCCARTRFTIGPNALLEERLSTCFGGRAVTFPSVTSAHMSALPLVAAGVLLPERPRRGVRLLFDRFAHASMQNLKPLLAEDAEIATLPHNDLDALEREVKDAHASGLEAVYVADGVYSMGGVCPLPEVLRLADQLGFSLYVDDAHGTSIFGERGEGYAVSACGGRVPENVIVAYSLSKGFGTNGGGVLLGSERQERTLRSFGQTYAFSAPLDFSIVGAAIAALDLHESGEVRRLQGALRERVRAYDDEAAGGAMPFSPIRMVSMPSAEAAIDAGERLVRAGFFVSVALFPVVPRDQPQLRVCLTAAHDEDDVRRLAREVRALRAVEPA